jgi:hypothetical protein
MNYPCISDFISNSSWLNTTASAERGVYIGTILDKVRQDVHRQRRDQAWLRIKHFLPCSVVYKDYYPFYNALTSV